jgi:hypothetical protein
MAMSFEVCYLKFELTAPSSNLKACLLQVPSVVNSVLKTAALPGGGELG